MKSHSEAFLCHFKSQNTVQQKEYQLLLQRFHFMSIYAAVKWKLVISNTLTIIVTKVTLKHSFTFSDDSNSGLKRGRSEKKRINSTTTK